MCAYIFINVDGSEVIRSSRGKLYERNIAYFTAIIVVIKIITNAYNARNVFVPLYFLPWQNLSETDFHIPRNNTPHVIPESPNSVWQRYSAIFTVGSFFFFLSTALYSIYAQRATTIKLLLRRCDTRSAAILAVYSYRGIYRLSDRSHRTPALSLPKTRLTRASVSFFSIYMSLKFYGVHGYDFMSQNNMDSYNIKHFIIFWSAELLGLNNCTQQTAKCCYFVVLFKFKIAYLVLHFRKNQSNIIVLNQVLAIWCACENTALINRYLQAIKM